ncbi:DUF2523 domain-containing protein [Lysobacter sp. HDW10]|uniref:DUF2523 family protein n=1 Tax=Lysobacter sp. HDW10 TaxID=2714936 RepID=UPI00140998EF|nr:DUF2523 family protein [Lysobacter sp. HDW10]QIK81672.1 DUF2523 domain-containing protein [Lysobacter sp. HDW10]
MPAILFAAGALLLDLAKRYLPTLVGRLMLAMGIGLATNNLVLPQLKALVQAQVGGLPGIIVAYFGALGLDKAFTIILSALAANAAAKVFLKKLPA